MNTSVGLGGKEIKEVKRKLKVVDEFNIALKMEK